MDKSTRFNIDKEFNKKLREYVTINCIKAKLLSNVWVIEYSISHVQLPKKHIKSGCLCLTEQILK